MGYCPSTCVTCVPAQASYVEAKEYFSQAERISPGFWKMNLVMLGKCEMKLNNNAAAAEFLQVGCVQRVSLLVMCAACLEVCARASFVMCHLSCPCVMSMSMCYVSVVTADGRSSGLTRSPFH